MGTKKKLYVVDRGGLFDRFGLHTTMTAEELADAKRKGLVPKDSVVREKPAKNGWSGGW